MTANNF